MKMNAGFPINVIMPSANMRAANTVNIMPATNPPNLVPAALIVKLSPPRDVWVPCQIVGAESFQQRIILPLFLNSIYYDLKGLSA